MTLLLALACTKDPSTGDSGATGDTGTPSTDSGEPCETSTWYTDSDGDSFGDPNAPVEACEQPDGAVEDNGDCDDSNADVNPAATEVCDGVDNDCDDAVDDDDSDWDRATGTALYADTDGDGYGDAGTSEVFCEASSGWVTDDTDCDDGNADVFPGAREEVDNGLDEDCDGGDLCFGDDDGDGYGTSTVVPSDDLDCEDVGESGTDDDCDDTDGAVFPGADEYCDGVDNDCDSEIDEDEALDVVTWYSDSDGDGYGDPTASDIDCDQPTDYVADDDDCDDTDTDTNPGADEYCDGHDDDCDGDIDEDDAVDASTWYADADGDSYGDPTDTDISCDQPSGYVSDSDDCDDSDADVNPDADEVCNGVDDDCDSSTGEDDTVLFTATDGTETDMSSSFSGTVTLADDGELDICDGRYKVNLEVEADVDIAGFNGDSSTVTLDGDGAASVVLIETDSVNVSLQSLTLTGGEGTGADSFSSASGGGLSCVASAGVTIDDVVIESNGADWGSGIFTEGCDTTVSSTTIDSNDADTYAAVFLYDGTHTWSEVEVTNNTSGQEVAGLFTYSDSSMSWDLEDVIVDGNIAGSDFQAAAFFATDVTWTGTGSGLAAVTNNDTTASSSDGAVYLADSTLEVDTVDFGTESGGDDNTDADLYLQDISMQYLAMDEASFECDTSACGSESNQAMGGSTTSPTGTYLLGSPFEVDADVTLHDFSFWVGGTSSCDVDLYILSATSTTDTSWTVEWASTGNSHTSDGDVSSGDIDYLMREGEVYTLAEAWTCDRDYRLDSSASTDLGFATADSYNYTSSVSEWSVGDTVTLIHGGGTYGALWDGEINYTEL